MAGGIGGAQVMSEAGGHSAGATHGHGGNGVMTQVDGAGSETHFFINFYTGTLCILYSIVFLFLLTPMIAQLASQRAFNLHMWQDLTISVRAGYILVPGYESQGEK